MKQHTVAEFSHRMYFLIDACMNLSSLIADVSLILIMSYMINLNHLSSFSYSFV